MKRLAVGAVCAAALALAAATPAAAFPPVGTAVAGEADARGFDFGALATCRLTLGGHVTGQEVFGGGTIRMDRLAFTGCSNGATVTANGLPWTLGTAPNLAAAFYPPDVNITTARGTCRYSGSMQGWTNGSGTWFLNGDVYKRTAGCGGFDDLRTRVTMSLRDSDGRPVRGVPALRRRAPRDRRGRLRARRPPRASRDGRRPLPSAQQCAHALARTVQTPP